MPHVSELQFKALTDGVNHPNNWPCRLLVTGQSEARRYFGQLHPTHVLSIKGTRTRYFGPTGLAEEHHLLMVFNDIVDDQGDTPPNLKHIEQMQHWMGQLPQDARLLIHCLQGVHRSCATALGFLAQQTNAANAVRLLRKIRPEADPNYLMVRLWDKRLELGGTLISAVRE